MSRIVAALLKQFGPTSGGGETCINVPVLTFTDNGDGSGGVATIAGASAGTTNTLWLAQDSGSAALVFTNEGHRSANGTLAVAAAAGQYIAYISSTDGTCTSGSIPVRVVFTAKPNARAQGGAPILVTKNPFQPMSWCKTPQGDIVGVNGLEQGNLWDGYNNFPSGPAAYKAGIAPPTSAPVVTQNAGTGGAVAGAYNYYYRYKDFSGRYSSLSPVATLALNDNDASVWSFAASSETTRVTNIELWRTISGGANRVYFITSLANATATYTDTLSDSTLENNAVSDPTTTDLLVNGDGTLSMLRFIPPPTNKAVVVWFQQRAFYWADVKYTTGLVDVVNESTTVVGLTTNWPTTFVGRYFYAGAAPRGYLIESINTDATNVFMTTPGSAPSSETQTITLPGATCGTWNWTLDGHTTTNLAYNAPATGAGSVESAITALANVGATNAAVSGSAAAGYVVTFQNALANTAIDLGTAGGTNLCGIPATVTRLVAGSAGGGGGGTQNEVQVIGFETIQVGGAGAGGCAAAIQMGDGGQFYFTFNGHSTPPISVHPDPASNGGPSAAQMTAYAEALASIGSGNIQVTDLAATGAIAGVCGAPGNANQFYGTGIMAWQFTFIGALAGETLPQMTITITPSTSSTGVKTLCGGLQNCQLEAIQCTTQQGSGGAGGGGSNPTDEVQEVALPAGTSGGTFTLTTNAITTAAIAWNASASAVASALNTATGGSNFSVTGNAGGPWIITFQGAYADLPQSLIVVNTASLTGGNIATAITTQGSAGVDCVQTLYLGSPTAGTYTLSFNGTPTAAIAYNANLAAIQSAVDTAWGAGKVTVANPSTGIYTFTFVGTLADSAQPLIIADLSSLTGAAVVQTLTLATAYLGATANNVTYTIRPAPEERNLGYYGEQNEAESVPNGDPAVPQSDPNTANSIKCPQFTERDDEVVGAYVYGPFQYILQSNHIILFDFQQIPKLDGQFSLVATRGAFNNDCCAGMDDAAFLMDREGAYALQEASVVPLSDDVQNYWRDGIIDFSKSDRFFVTCDPTQKVARFHYCTSSDAYPKQALCYSVPLKQWWPETYHEEMGAGVVYPVNGAWRRLLGGASGLVHLAQQGNADVVDSTTETGTMGGTVTGATANTLTDSTATFTDTMLGAPVAIIAGAAAGQTNTILSHTGTGLTFASNWGVTPSVGDTYRIGAISWTYKTGSMELMVQPTSGQTEVPMELARGLRSVWEPTTNFACYWIQRFYDNKTSPETYYADINQGDGLTVALNATVAVQEMTLNRDTVDQVNQQSKGYTRFQFDSGGSDFSITRRYVTLVLSGFQCQDSIRFFDLEVQGVLGE